MQPDASQPLVLACPPAPTVVLHEVHDHAGLSARRLFATARRANPKRSILFVSHVLGKHLATNPDDITMAGERLADLVASRLGDIREPTVIGFAETATALAHVVRRRLEAAAFTHTTRLPVDQPPRLSFAEPHSHAPDHDLHHRDPTFLTDGAPVVIVDDEMTTGTTALNLIRAIQHLHPRDRYVIAVLTDFRDAAAVAAHRAATADIGTQIDVVSLLHAQVEVGASPTAGPDLAPPSPLAAAAPPDLTTLRLPLSGGRGHLGWDRHDEARLDRWARAAADELVEATSATRIDVVGWEEVMYPPLRLAAALHDLGRDTRVRSTTRSPIVPADTPGYPIRDGIAWRGDDARPRYLYNLAVRQAPDAVVLCAPVEPPGEMLHALAGNGPTLVVRTDAASGDAGPQPPAGFGSYDPDDVTFLLTPLEKSFAESSLAERERAVARGGHYSERLPIEYEPSPAYEQLFDETLRRQAPLIAELVATTAERILAHQQGSPFVLVSLARAGTPVGVLLRRYLRDQRGVDAPHHSISIIRDRGLDRAAIGWLRARYPGAELQFVDGWTGKGAIQTELSKECAELGLSDALAVLADPAACAALPGTREDVLVPSACLNATVSGLVSRTVWRQADIDAGRFHAARHYDHLSAHDRSAELLDVVTAELGRVGADPAAAGGALDTPWHGRAWVEAIAAAHDVTDLRKVKPGLGEALRVMLRRKPRLLLLRASDADTAPLERLADERAVRVEKDPLLPYRACGIIA